MSGEEIEIGSNRRIPNEEEEQFRDIQVLTPSNYNRPPGQGWDSSSDASENFTTISREFNALVLAGSNTINNSSSINSSSNHNNIMNSSSNLEMIGEGEEDRNPLAIVQDRQPINPPQAINPPEPENRRPGSAAEVKKEEADNKIAAWQNAKVAKINNRFKRENALINSWENHQLHKSTSWINKIERKLEEKKAKAVEKMENDIAKARRKAEEKRASAEAKRGIKIARVLEVANFMRAIGKPPSKRSFF